MAEPRGHFKTNALQGECAIAAALAAPDLAGKGQLQFFSGRAGLANIFVVEKAR